MKKISLLIILLIVLQLNGAFLQSAGAVQKPEPQNHESYVFYESRNAGIPANYVHRPIFEFFTGLSCPSCMNGVHQDMDRLWEDNANSLKYTYVVFHQLHGGGEDDLATEETKERIEYYQPGVSGTPAGEFDGGYIELGGLSGREMNYNSASNAIDDCKERYKVTFNPLHPISSIKNNFKFVNLYVWQVFGNDSYTVIANVKYLGTNAIIERSALSGSLYIFMVEDNVTAYSTALKNNIVNHAVFRGYGAKDIRFELKKDESFEFKAKWKIPDAKIKIKSKDLRAIAVVYDLDDTSSEKNNMGNKARAFRAIQSSTPESTAHDLKNEPPSFIDVSSSHKNGKINIEAKIDDKDGIAKAYIFFNFNSTNSTDWENTEMKLEGKELCDENGACYAYSAPNAKAEIKAKGKKLYYMILAYDGNLTFAKSQIFEFNVFIEKEKKSNNNIGIAVILALIIFCILIIFLITKVKRFFNWTS